MLSRCVSRSLFTAARSAARVIVPRVASIQTQTTQLRSFSSADRKLKSELTALLDDQVKEYNSTENEEVMSFLEHAGWKLDQPEPNKYTLSKQVRGYAVTVRFPLEHLENEENEDAAAEEDPEADEERVSLKPHHFDVDIASLKDASSFVRVTCYANPEGIAEIDSINVDPKCVNPKEDGEGLDIYSVGLLQDFPEQLGDKFIDYLVSLGLDDDLALFIQQFTQQERDKKRANLFSSIKEWVSAGQA